MSCEAATVAFVTEDRKVLLIRRAENPNDPWSGQIAMPGGRVEPGESCEQAAVREALEEVGRAPENLVFIGVFQPLNRPVTVYAYISCSEHFEPKINKDEVSEAFWFSLDDIKGDENEIKYKNYVIWGMTLRILKEIKSKRLFEKCQKGNDSS